MRYRRTGDRYYHAEVAGWNPWGVPDEAYDFGQLMPDYLIAVQPFQRTFRSNERARRTVHTYNQLFEDLAAELVHELVVAGETVSSQRETFELRAGERQSFDVRLNMPSVQQREAVQWRLTLRAGDTVLTERIYDYTVFPVVRRLGEAEDVALVTPGDDAAGPLANARFRRGTHRSLEAALGSGARSLVLAGVELTSEEGAKLERAVRDGLRVLWLEVPAESWLPTPLQLDPQHRAAHVFVRSPHDPLVEGLDEQDLRYWGADTLAVERSLFKPDRGRFEILLDAGGPEGLDTAALLRLHRGEGSYVMCQMPVLSKAADEPAAMALLQRLVGSLGEPAVSPGTEPLVLAAGENSPVRDRLVALDVPFVEATSQPIGVLVVDASSSLDDDRLSLIVNYLESGHDVLLQRLGEAAAEQLADRLDIGVTVESSDAQQLLHVTSDPLLAGLSHDDWYWAEAGDDVPAIVSGVVSGDEAWRALTRPAGLAVRDVGSGRLIVSQVRWDEPEAVSRQATRSARVALTLLANTGADIGQLTPGDRQFVPVALAEHANRGFHDQPDESDRPRGWFAGGRDDMRYFPVNRTGLDPVHNVPAPVEPFPEQPTYGGVRFDLVNPDDNVGRSVLVLGGDEQANGLPSQVTFAVDQQASRVWMLGALERMVGSPEQVATLQWTYADGTRAQSPITAGIEVSGYQYFDAVRRGRVGWTGNNPQRNGVVLYVWDVINPHPERQVRELRLSSESAVGLAVAGMTLEQTSSRP
ncbi:hypothetical protein ACERK3_17460 [Phycisphaerales bacterium AB-hyl4]|uniref:Uncharacterized protein n=1 Tax=Natronomicrosphaera hydrolytica TaxID=3242702 RepID=A0ABV4U8Y2_9BACT